MNPLKKICGKALRLSLVAGAGLALWSCHNDPATPTNELLTKDHGDPAKATLTLSVGTLDGERFRADASKPAQVVAYGYRKGKGWTPLDDSAPSFRVNGGAASDSVYQLTIRYHDARGNDITGEFIENKQDNIHQHFFRAMNASDANGSIDTDKGRNTPSFFDYTYADTTPWNADDAALTGPENPIGFKGVFRFVKTGVRFDLQIDLLHAATSKFRDGKASPYYAPARGQILADHWDLQMTVPIIVGAADSPTAGTTPSAAPASAKLVLAAGHFHGERFHQDPVKDGVKFLKALQTIDLQLKDGRWVIDEKSEDKAFYVKANSKYGLWIYYYDKNGQVLNGQYIANGADRLHQHFFSGRNAAPYGEGVAENDDNDTEALFEYYYWDTTPWDKTLNDAGTTMTGEANPIGFKGWFEFLKDRKRLTLRIELMHARTSKFTNDTASPYYAPTDAQRRDETFAAPIDIPVVTLYTRGEEVFWSSETGTSYEALTEKEKKMVRAVADAYKVTPAEALADFFRKLNQNGNPESGTLWF